MRKQHSSESKHVQQSRDRYGKKLYPYSKYTPPVVRCEGVAERDIVEFCQDRNQSISFRTNYNLTGTVITSSRNVPSGQIWYYNGFEDSEKYLTLKDLALKAFAKFPEQYDADKHWDMLQSGMISEWKLRQTKLYKALR